MNKLKNLFCLFFVAFFAQILIAQNTQEPLLIIGSDSIYPSEFITTYSKNNDFQKATEQDLREYLDLFINFKLKVKEGENLKIDTVPRFKAELKSYEKQSSQQYLVDKEVTDLLLHEAYERSRYYLRASHILFACDKNAEPKDTLLVYNKALQVRNQILNGEISFADAAVKYSEDPSARDFVNPQTGRSHVGNRGDLGFFSVFDLVYPFESGAFNTPVGQISLPVRTQFGYHLIYVTRKIDAVQNISVEQIYLNDTTAKRGLMLPTTKERILAIQADLKAGKSFEELVPIYTEDKATANNNGLMEPFSPNHRHGDFVEAVLNLKLHEISQPIASQTGWHIVKLMGIENYELNDQMKAEIKNQISRDSRSYKSKESFVAKLKKDYQYDEKNRAKGLKYVMAKLPADFFSGVPSERPTLPKDIRKVKPLCTFGDTAITTEFFFIHISRYRGLELNKTQAMKFLNERLDYLVEEKLIQYEYAHLMDKYPEYRALQKEFHDGMVLYEMNTEKVWAAAMNDSIGLEKFYRQNLTKYVDPQTSLPQPLDEIRAVVITDYQEYLDKKWIAELREKYQPVLNEKVFNNLLKR